MDGKRPDDSGKNHEATSFVGRMRSIFEDGDDDSVKDIYAPRVSSPSRFLCRSSLENRRKEIETPRLWKDGSAAENVARRQGRRVNFSPPRLRYFSTQQDVVKPVQADPLPDDQPENTEVEDSSTSADSKRAAAPLKPEPTPNRSNKSTLESTLLGDSPPRSSHKSGFKSPDSAVRPIITRTDAQSQLITSEKMYHPPTQLHDICYKAKSVAALMDFLRTPHVRGRDLSSAAARKDNHGRLPLHVLSENHPLATFVFSPPTTPKQGSFTVLSPASSFGVIGASNDQKITKFLLEALLVTNAPGVTWKDHDGYVPFERALVMWTRQTFSLQQTASAAGESKKSLTSFSRRKTAASETLHNVWMSTRMSMSSATTWAGRSLQPQGRDDVQVDNSEDDMLGDASIIDPEAPVLRFPSNVRLTSLVRFAIKMLSHVIEELQGMAVVVKNGNSTSVKRRRVKREESEIKTDSFDEAMDDFRSFCHAESAEDLVDTLVETIASIPNLLLTIFLLDDKQERDWALESTLMKRVAVHRAAVGPWLNSTLQSMDKNVRRRALDYLLYVSAQNDGMVRKYDFHEAVSQLEGFIPSLLALEERQIEEVATTPVVVSVLNKLITRPFAISVVFFDFAFLLLLMTGFRYAVNRFITGADAAAVLKWIYVANTGIFYFIIREIGKAIAIMEHTRQARIYLWSFWNITDILSTILALSSTIAIRLSFSLDITLDDTSYLRALLAVTTGLLWLRALSLLKSLNIQLATFVLAILQICKDVVWFLVILFALVASFAQMFYTLLLPPSCAVEETFATEKECSQAEYYLRVYTVLLGDFGQFDRAEFGTAFAVFLMVVFSFVVVIVLLNVLIAIVSDSYEKCLVRSLCLFGRARVLLIAELASFQNLLRKLPPKRDPNDKSVPDGCWSSITSYWTKRGWSSGSSAFFFLSAFVVIVWSVAETGGYLAGDRQGKIVFSFLSIIVNVALFAGIVAFLSRGAKRISDKSDYESSDDSSWYNWVQRSMSRLLSKPLVVHGAVGGGSGTEIEEWSGRLNYLQNEMERISQETSTSMADHVKSVEQHVALSSSHVHAEIANMDESMSEFKTQVLTELARMERKNDDTMQSILEAIKDSSRSSLGFGTFLAK